MAAPKKKMQSLLDREIASQQEDAFGHRHFAEALEALIESSLHQPPYSIGLLGKWGSGKSSIKAMYLSSLKDDEQKDAAGRRRSDRVFPITFNAWRFGGENIKRALLRHVYLGIGGDKKKLEDALFRKLQETSLEARDWKEMKKEFYEKVLWTPLQLLLVLGVIAGLLAVVGSLFDLSELWVALAALVGVGWIATQALKLLPILNKMAVARYSPTVRVDEPRTAAEQYEDLLLEQLDLFKQGKVTLKDVPKSKAKNCERLVVFVDDLDRLSADEMITGMDAIRTFMEIPESQLPDRLGVIFVISCDEERVADALANRDQVFSNPDLPGAVFSKCDARRYLDRIFQFRLEIPELPKMDMRNFAMQRLTHDLSDVAADIEAMDIPLQNVIDRMIHVGVKSPRNALQILNAFCQCWWLAKQREREGAGTERAGGLQEGSVTKHPIALAAICALRVDFPDFFVDLEKEPDLIQRFSDVFIRNQPIEQQVEETQAILSKYAEKKKENEVRSEHRQLRQFIVSLQGLRWPPTLQPLLALSQDPVTRTLGDKAVPLWNAFRTGDDRELLRLLGRDQDSKPLSGENVRKLKEMVEELHHESVVMRDNAAACLAAIAGRLPEGDAHHLMSPLARRLADSNALRWRLGIPKIRAILPAATPEDRRDVAARLTADVLRTEGDIEFRLESGQQPALDEALEMAQEACSVVLWVRELDALDSESDTALLKWLEVRRVAIGGKEDAISFADFEAWVAEHEDNLLLDLRERYTHLAADQFEQNELASIDQAEMLGRCRRVLTAVWDEGEDSRAVFWEQLSRFASVHSENAVSLSWKLAKGRVDGQSQQSVAKYVIALTGRQVKHLNEESVWPLDRDAAAEALISVVAEAGESLADSAITKATEIADLWSNSDNTAAFARQIVQIPAIMSGDNGSELLTGWIGRVLTNLPAPCLEWCAANSNGLADPQRNNLVKQFQKLVNQEDAPQSQAQQYVSFAANMPDEAISSDWFAGHLNNLCAQMQNRHPNPNNYLNRIFPVMPHVVDHCAPGPLGNMLHALFPQIKDRPPLLGLLHSFMTGHWPKQSEEYGPYNPQQLFNDAIEVVQNQPAKSNVDKALLSAESMLRGGVVPDTMSAKLTNAACVIWPHKPGAAQGVWESIDEAPSLDRIANLADGIDVNAEGQRGQLGTAWLLLSAKLDSTMKRDTTSHLLGKGPKGFDEEPDFCLRLWIDCTGDDAQKTLRDLLISSDLNDGQRKRVWLQSEARIDLLGQPLFTDVIPVLLKMGDSPETVQSVFESQEALDTVFPTADDRYTLAKALIQSFEPAPSQETKNRILGWIKRIKAESALRELESSTTLSQDDFNIIKELFPKSRHLKRLTVAADDVG